MIIDIKYTCEKLYCNTIEIRFVEKTKSRQCNYFIALTNDVFDNYTKFLSNLNVIL